MNGHQQKSSGNCWFAKMAFKALNSVPGWKERFERDFGMSPSHMEEGYMKQDAQFCSGLTKMGGELAEAHPEQFSSVQAFAGHGGNFPSPSGLGIPNKTNTTTN